jgi:lipopolysaccharide/colanic/teichoic acid biosynthesis glycosyltransferase
MNERVLKRLFDLFFSALGLFLLMPLMVLIAIAIRLESRGPAIVAHRRLGRNEKPFRLFRFRTRSMRRHGEAEFTEFGRVLEETGLADLPQLWNILKGDLSVIGPLATSATSAGASGGKRLFSVQPGIISLAALDRSHDRPGAVSAQRRSIVDAWNVEHRSMMHDLDILFRKAWQELRRTLPIRSEKC